MNINKSFLKSKTMWASLFVAVVTELFPASKEIIKEHPDYVMYAIGFIFSALRITTTKPLTVKKS